jgi:hypothetical protein
MRKNLKNLAVAIPSISIASGSVDPKTLTVNLINYALFFIGALALVFVIYGGILFVTSGGDAEKTTKARNTLLYAVIGVIVVVLAYAIVNWASTFGGQL